MPRFYLHSDEKYFSMHIDNYKTYCKESEDHLKLTVENFACKFGATQELQILASVIELTDDDNKPVVDLVYYIFYPYSGEIGVFNKGAHWYDMEHVTIRFLGTKSDLSAESTPYKVLFSIHSKYRWFDWNSRDLCKFYDDAHEDVLEVYIAKGSHACYPHAGSYCRYFGVANDTCNSGIIPLNVNIVMHDLENPIFKYTSICEGTDRAGCNWNCRELLYGESPAYSSYSKSITSYMFT